MAIDGEYDPELHGTHQIDKVELALTNKACLRDLLICNCFHGAVEIEEFYENQLGKNAQNVDD